MSDDPEEVQPNTNTTYGELMSEDGLTALSEWATGIGPSKYSLLNYNETDYPSLGLLEEAHSLGLLVHPYTFRPEPMFVDGEFGGDPVAEIVAVSRNYFIKL